MTKLKDFEEDIKSLCKQYWGNAFTITEIEPDDRQYYSKKPNPTFRITIID